MTQDSASRPTTPSQSFRYRGRWLVFSALIILVWGGWQLYLGRQVSDLHTEQRNQGDRITNVERRITKQCKNVCRHAVALEVIRILNQRSTGVSLSSGPGVGPRSSTSPGPSTGSVPGQGQPSATPGSPSPPTAPAPGDGGEPPPSGGGGNGGGSPGTQPGSGNPPPQPPQNPITQEVGDLIDMTNDAVQGTLDSAQGIACQTAPALCQ